MQIAVYCDHRCLHELVSVTEIMTLYYFGTEMNYHMDIFTVLKILFKLYLLFNWLLTDYWLLSYFCTSVFFSRMSFCLWSKKTFEFKKIHVFGHIYLIDLIHLLSHYVWFMILFKVACKTCGNALYVTIWKCMF